MKGTRLNLCVTIVALALLAGRPIPAVAGFKTNGHGLQTIITGQAANCALYVDTKNLWLNTGTYPSPPGGNGPYKPYQVHTTHTMPPLDSVQVARLYMTIWGGTNSYTATLDVSVNGTSVVSGLLFGGTSDANPVFSAAQTCVYGSGSGVWLVSVPVPGALLHGGDTPNDAVVTISDPTQLFDGRMQYISLLAVYRKASLGNLFTYSLAEGSGDIYRTPAAPDKVDSRTITIGSITIPCTLASGWLHAIYTYGTKGENDRLFLNGAQVGSDDVAHFDPTVTGLDFGPDVVSFDVTSLLAATNTVRFSVSASDVPGTRESSLRPQVAILSATYSPVTDSDGDGVPDCLDSCPGTVAGSPVDAQGCPPVIPGDFNHNGAVDADDLEHFEACALGPAIPQSASECLNARLDADDDVDQADFGIFQRCWSSSLPADPACAN